MSTERRRTALVTGASRGIGRAIALKLSADGYDIVAVARKQEELDTLANEVRAAGGKCRGIALDLSDPWAIATGLGGIDVDVLVNNAGVGVIKPFAELTPAEWNSMIDLNINALYHVTRAALPGMLARGSGHVCTIGSIGGRGAWVGGSCYGATKAFVNSWAEMLMLEVRDRGIKVSVIQPGGVATEFGGQTPDDSSAWKLSAAEVAEAVSVVVAQPGHVLIHRLEIRTNDVPRKH